MLSEISLNYSKRLINDAKHKIYPTITYKLPLSDLYGQS